jgi:hypothetical protein
MFPDGKNYIVQLMHSTGFGLTSVGDVKSVFKLPNSINVGFGPVSMVGNHTYPYYSFQIPQSLISSKKVPLPTFEAKSSNTQGNVFVPLSNSTHLPPELRCFLTAYFLGMMVPYFPSHWMAIIRSRKGDAILPLIRVALDHIDREFPSLILSRLAI